MPVNEFHIISFHQGSNTSAASFGFLPEPRVQQSTDDVSVAAVLHHGIQRQVGLLVNEVVRSLRQFQQQSSTCNFDLWVHGRLEVDVHLGQCFHGCTSHCRAQVVYLHREEQTASVHSAVFTHTQ